MSSGDTSEPIPPKAIAVPSLWLARCGAAAMLAMMIHISADVAAKYLINHPIDGTLEIVSIYYMVIVVFFPLAYVSQGEGHIKVELFTRGLSSRSILLLEAVIGIVAVAYIGLIGIGGLQEAYEKTMLGEQMETANAMMDKWPSRWIVPVGSIAMAVYLAWRSASDFRRSISSRGDVNL